MICPNHKTEQAETGSFVSDTVHKRLVLTCGCAPSQEELLPLGVNLGTAAVPEEPIPAPLLIEVDQFDPAVEEERIRNLVSKILNQARQEGIDLANLAQQPIEGEIVQP